MPDAPSSQDAATERDRFERLWREHYAAVLAFVLRRIDDRALAEEATAETFLVAWRRRDQVPDDPRVWLLGVARRTTANARRGQQRSSALIARVQDHQPRGDAGVGGDGVREAKLAAAFARLRPADQETLALVVWDGLAPREAARVVGIPVARFSVRLHRAKQRLRHELDQPIASPAEAQTTHPLMES